MLSPGTIVIVRGKNGYATGTIEAVYIGRYIVRMHDEIGDVRSVSVNDIAPEEEWNNGVV